MDQNDQNEPNEARQERAYGILKELTSKGFKAYIVGGAVRDTILEKIPEDWDIFTDATGEKLLEIYPDGKIIGNEERQEKILTVVVDGTEVSTFRSNPTRTETGGSLLEHQGTCDFTINSLAMDMDGTIYDSTGGEMDLFHKVIRAVGDPKDRISEDPLRILRAIRFAVKYDFQIDPELVEVIQNTSIRIIAVERIREEFMKIIQYSAGPILLDRLGLLPQIFYWWPTMRIPGGKYHGEQVDEHSFYCHNIMCNYTDDPLLKFTALVHDIGKPISATMKDDGNLTFIGHDIEGAKAIHKEMERMKFSLKETAYVEALIRNHQYPLKIKAETSSFRGLHRAFRALEDAKVPIEHLILLRYCDRQANLKTHRETYTDFLTKYIGSDAYYTIKYNRIPIRTTELWLDGDEIMGMFGLEPGPKVGIIMKYLLKLSWRGNFHDLTTMLNYINKQKKGIENHVKREEEKLNVSN